MEKLLNIKQVAEMLNVTQQTLRNWDTSGKLVALRTPTNRRKYKLSDIEGIINNNQ